MFTGVSKLYAHCGPFCTIWYQRSIFSVLKDCKIKQRRIFKRDHMRPAKLKILLSNVLKNRFADPWMIVIIY
jgi:hypothetical protein